MRSICGVARQLYHHRASYLSFARECDQGGRTGNHRFGLATMSAEEWENIDEPENQSTTNSTMKQSHHMKDPKKLQT